ncbi:MAG: phosphoribosyltransferase family protein [Bacteroidota bacterium]
MSQSAHKVQILTSTAVKAKLRRMAYEIYERNYDCERLVIIGIGGRGGYIADQLTATLNEISPMVIERLGAVKEMDRDLELEATASRIIPGQAVILVDDVLYSGLTMFHVLRLVMQHNPQRVQTAVLIDRGHRNVPVTHDFVGIELATSLQQYVSVEIKPAEKEAAAYLF